MVDGSGVDPSELSPEELKERARKKLEEEKEKGSVEEPDVDDIDEDMSELGGSRDGVRKRQKLVEKFTAAGWTAGALANIFDVSERTIRSDLKEIRDRNKERVVEMGEDHASFEEIGNIISKYDIMAEELFRIFFEMKQQSQTADDYFNVKLEALKEARQFLSQKTDLLRRTGIFPDRDAIEAMFVDNRKQVVMDDNDRVPDEIKDTLDDPEKRMQVRKMIEKLSSKGDKAAKIAEMAEGASEQQDNVVDAESTE